MPCRRVFVRDLQDAWYHQGIPEWGETVDEVVDTVRGLLQEWGARRVLAVGNSAGGYASVLFGYLLGMDAVLAFSPQTLLSISAREALGLRQREAAARVEATTPTPAYLDLPVVCSGVPFTPSTDVYLNPLCRRDRVQAEALAAAVDIRVHHRTFGEKKMHSIVKPMRDAGELRPILERFVGGCNQV